MLSEFNYILLLRGLPAGMDGQSRPPPPPLTEMREDASVTWS